MKRRGTRRAAPGDEGGKVGPNARASGVDARGLGVCASVGEGTAMVRDHGSALGKRCKLPCS